MFDFFFSFPLKKSGVILFALFFFCALFLVQ